MKCIDCPVQIYNNPRGRPRIRCQPCTKAKNLKDMKVRYQAKKTRFEDKAAIEADAVYLASIPTYEEIFGPQFHDSGTGVDRGSSEE